MNIYRFSFLSLFATLFAVVLAFSSCSDEIEEADFDFGYEYFPTTIGLGNVYQVDSTIYNFFSDSVYVHSWQVQEVITQEDVDAEGRPRFRVEQRKREDNSPWTGITPKIWYSIRTDQVAERLEDNLRFLKLVFPAKEGEQWFGNSYIDTEEAAFVGFDDWLYRIVEEGESKTVGGLTYDKTLTVNQNDFSNLQQKIYAEEIYAEGIGLVYKEYQDLKLQASSLPAIEEVPWPGRSNDGVFVSWTRLE